MNYIAKQKIKNIQATTTRQDREEEDKLREQARNGPLLVPNNKVTTIYV